MSSNFGAMNGSMSWACPTGQSRTPCRGGTSWRFYHASRLPAAALRRSTSPPADPADAGWAADLQTLRDSAHQDTILSPSSLPSASRHASPSSLPQAHHKIRQVERQQLSKLFRGHSPRSSCLCRLCREFCRDCARSCSFASTKDAWFYPVRCRIFLECCAQSVVSCALK